MGRLIAFDGLDASGKTTQAKILEKKLSGAGMDILYISFPEYESESSILARLYLDGALGKNPADVNAYAASSFFAADRYVSYITKWKSFYEKENSVILANRYTTANAVHQTAKLPEHEWNGFLFWLYDYEFEKLKLPKPDLTVLFDMHPDAAFKLMEERAKNEPKKKDIHESDLQYLKKCYKAGHYAADSLDWKKITCYKKDENGGFIPKTEEEINGDLMGLVNDHGF